MSNTQTAKKTSIKKTLSFNPMNGHQFESIEDCIKELKATISEDTNMWFWTLEYQFWFLFNTDDSSDNDVLKKTYRLYQMFNSIMVSLIDEPEPKI